jgi:MFS family permease
VNDIDQRPRGWQDLRGRRNLARLVLVCLGVWLHAADGLMVATMMPRIIGDIGGARLVSWTISLYEIGSIVAGASGAFLCMRYGLRAAMTASALVYMVGCGISALAPAMWVMLVGRLAQGLGGGGLVALSFIAVSLLFSRALMPRVMAAVSALWGMSAFIGPLVGGAFADSHFWRGGFWFFAAQAAVLAACIGFGSALTSRDATVAGARRLPLWRVVVLSVGVLAIAAAGIDVSLPRTPLFMAAGFLFLALFLRMDGWREDSRLLPPQPVDARTGLGAALLMVLCFSAATIAASVYGPLLLTQLHGVSALTAGYIVAASSIGWSVMAVIVSGAREKHDGPLILGGMGVLTLSIVGFMLTVPHGPLWLVAVCAALEGIGFGMSWTFILRRVTVLAPVGETERASAALPTLQRLGYALGAAYVGIVANAVGIADSMDRTTAQAVGFWIFAACLPLAAIGLLSAWRFIRFGNASQAALPQAGTPPA